MKTRMTIEQQGEEYLARLAVEGRHYRATGPDMAAAAITAFFCAVVDYRRLKFPLLDLIGAHAAENDLQELCDICDFNIPGNNKGKDYMCTECIHFCNWRRA